VTPENAEKQHPVHIPIEIDNTHFQVPSEHMTGAALRALPTPDVPADRDLWLEVHGPKDDELIDPSKTYTVKPGSRYYTAPRTINPGA
jgi:hypothetical protein